MIILLVFPSWSWLVILTPGGVKLNGMWAPNMKLPQVTTELSQYQWHPMVLIASKVSLFIVAVQFCIHKMQQLSSLHPNLSGFLLRKPLYSAGGSDIEKGLSRLQRKASTQPVLADRSPNGCNIVPLPIVPHLLLFPNSWSLSFHKRLSNLETSTNWHPEKKMPCKIHEQHCFHNIFFCVTYNLLKVDTHLYIYIYCISIVICNFILSHVSIFPGFFRVSPYPKHLRGTGDQFQKRPKRQRHQPQWWNSWRHPPNTSPHTSPRCKDVQGNSKFGALILMFTDFAYCKSFSTTWLE